jgi:hypothetical protein
VPALRSLKFDLPWLTDLLVFRFSAPVYIRERSAASSRKCKIIANEARSWGRLLYIFAFILAQEKAALLAASGYQGIKSFKSVWTTVFFARFGFHSTSNGCCCCIRALFIGFSFSCFSFRFLELISCALFLPWKFPRPFIDQKDRRKTELNDWRYGNPASLAARNKTLLRCVSKTYRQVKQFYIDSQITVLFMGHSQNEMAVP